MIWGIEGIHAWTPPDGSGVIRTNLIENPYAGAGAAAKWTSSGLESGPSAVTLGAGEAPAATTLPLTGVTTGFQAKGNSAADRAVATVAVTTGKTYRFSVYVWVKEASTSTVQLVARNNLSTVKATSAVNSKEEGWLRLDVSVVADSTANWTFGIEQTAAGATNFFWTGALLEVSSRLDPYFPLPAQVISGRAKFTGTAHESTSTFEAPILTLNRLFDDSGAELWPRYKLKSVSGLMSLGDAEDNRDLPVGRVGELARLAYRRGKTVVYEGAIKAQSLLQLREAEANLRAAFAEESGEGCMDVRPHPLDTQWVGVPEKFFEGRALTCEVVDVQNSKTWERGFVVAVRMGDPRYFQELETLGKATVANTNTSVDFE